MLRLTNPLSARQRGDILDRCRQLDHTTVKQKTTQEKRQLPNSQPHSSPLTSACLTHSGGEVPPSTYFNSCHTQKNEKVALKTERGSAHPYNPNLFGPYRKLESNTRQDLSVCIRAAKIPRISATSATSNRDTLFEQHPSTKSSATCPPSSSLFLQHKKQSRKEDQTEEKSSNQLIFELKSKSKPASTVALTPCQSSTNVNNNLSHKGNESIYKTPKSRSTKRNTTSVNLTDLSKRLERLGSAVEVPSEIFQSISTPVSQSIPSPECDHSNLDVASNVWNATRSPLSSATYQERGLESPCIQVDEENQTQIQPSKRESISPSIGNSTIFSSTIQCTVQPDVQSVVESVVQSPVQSTLPSTKPSTLPSTHPSSRFQDVPSDVYEDEIVQWIPLTSAILFESEHFNPFNRFYEMPRILSQFDTPFEQTQRVLGEGGYGTVILIRRRSDGKGNELREYALKVMLKENYKLRSMTKQLERELVYHHQCSSHQYVVKMYELFETSTHSICILERMHLSIVDIRGFITESEVGFFINQILLAVEYIHVKGILHRDIKPDNILLNLRMNVAKLADFGWCSEYQEGDEIREYAGSFQYMAPEILMNELQSDKTDIWAIGCCTYELLVGEQLFPISSPPFHFHGHPNDWFRTDMIYQQQADYFLKIHRCVQVGVISKLASDFIIQCTQFHSHYRPTASQALSHAWIRSIFSRYEISNSRAHVHYHGATGHTKTEELLQSKEVSQRNPKSVSKTRESKGLESSHPSSHSKTYDRCSNLKYNNTAVDKENTNQKFLTCAVDAVH